ncbi:MAG: hypothetical protein ACKE5M_02040 [Methylophilaceae bacterium]
MNNDTMRLVAQFTIRARKVIGQVDLKQFTEDENYREEIFKKMDEHGDEDLLVMSLSLRDSLKEASNNDQEAETKPETPTKYVFGPRG